MANLEVTDEQAETLRSMVQSGLYPDIASFIDEAIQASFEREMEYHARRQSLRDAIAVGEADIAAGRYTEFRSREEIADHFRNRAAAVLKAAE